jgi:hypothetical protein
MPHVQEDDHFFNDDEYNSTTFNDATNGSSTSNVIDTITAGANAMDPVDRILHHWTPIRYGDFLVAVLGIYVSILGMRASNENCIRTARYYLIGTTITAIGWLTYNYIINYEIDVQVDAHPEKYYDMSDDNYRSHATTNDDAMGESYSTGSSYNSSYFDESPYHQAFTAMILPGMVWGLCIFRAWQFHHVLYDAEMEAAQRTDTMMMMSTMEEEDEDEEDTNDPSLPVEHRHRHRTATSTTGDVELSTISDGIISNPRTEQYHTRNNTNTTSTLPPSSLPVGMMA